MSITSLRSSWQLSSSGGARKIFCPPPDDTLVGVSLWRLRIFAKPTFDSNGCNVQLIVSFKRVLDIVASSGEGFILFPRSTGLPLAGRCILVISILLDEFELLQGSL